MNQNSLFSSFILHPSSFASDRLPYACIVPSDRRIGNHPEARAMPVLLLGTLDTKGNEIAFVRDRLAAAEVSALVADAGILGPPAFTADIPREQLFAVAGTSVTALQQAGDRGKAVEAAARGAARIAQQLHAEGKLEGVLSLGGSAGTTIGTAAM